MKAVLLAALLPTTALAQGACPAEITVDPCLTGNWIGENSVGMTMQRFLAENAPAGVSRNTFPDQPPVLGMTVYDDGFYTTLPFNTTTMWQDVTEEDTIDAVMDLRIGTAVGYIWGNENILQFCSTGEEAPVLRVEATSDLSGSRSAVISPGGGEGFLPLMTYSCTASYLQIDVALPAPIGIVTYNLTRYGDDSFSDAFREMIDAR